MIRCYLFSAVDGLIDEVRLSRGAPEKLLSYW